MFTVKKDRIKKTFDVTIHSIGLRSSLRDILPNFPGPVGGSTISLATLLQGYAALEYQLVMRDKWQYPRAFSELRLLVCDLLLDRSLLNGFEVLKALELRGVYPTYWPAVQNWSIHGDLDGIDHAFFSECKSPRWVGVDSYIRAATAGARRYRSVVQYPKTQRLAAKRRRTLAEEARIAKQVLHESFLECHQEFLVQSLRSSASLKFKELAARLGQYEMAWKEGITSIRRLATNTPPKNLTQIFCCLLVAQAMRMVHKGANSETSVGICTHQEYVRQGYCLSCGLDAYSTDCL